MPPSISRRQSPQSLSQDDTTASSQDRSQAVRDFQARKVLLCGGGGGERRNKKNRKKSNRTDAKSPSSKRHVISKSKAEGEGGEPAAAPLRSCSALETTGGYGGGTNAMNMGMGLGGYGMGMGYGMYGGMMGSPYGIGMIGGPLNGLNQFLFSVQTAIYSLSSAVQVIGMNTHALQQLLDAASKMVDHASTTFHELRALDATAQEGETEEKKMRRRRLKALRWSLIVASTYAAYKLVRLLQRPKRRRLAADQYSSSTGCNSTSSVPSTSYGGGYNLYPQQSNYMSPGMGMRGVGHGSTYGGGFY